MGDGDDLVAEAEREQRLGGRGDEARDPHAATRLWQHRATRWLSCSPTTRSSARLGGLDGWERDGEAIVKTFERGDFVGSVEFVDKLVEPAEEMGHHPDLSISWNKVEVSITTHSAGGLTANDFELAKRIDALA